MSGTLHQIGFNILLSAAEAGPKWQKVFPLGETRHRDDFGSITFDRELLGDFVRNYAEEGKPKRPWNYFHRGSSNDKEVANEDKVAAGWFSDVELRADGLYVLTEWTPKAKAHIDAKELQYPSPEFSESATDPKTGKSCGGKLFAVALLNDPFLTDLPAVQASINPAPKGLVMKLNLASLVAAAQLAADITEENLETALKAKAAELAAKSKELVELKAKVESKETAGADVIKKLSERVEAQGAELKTMREAKAAADVVALQAKLETEGRILAAEKPMVAELVTALGLEKATAMTAGFPVKVDLKERGTNREGPANGMDPAEAHKQLELKAAELAKANPADAPQAYLLAAKANPELAKAAQRMKPPEDRRS